MIKLLLKKVNHLIFTIIFLALSHAGIAQCPATANISGSYDSATNQFTVLWTPVVGATGYLVNVSYDNGPLISSSPSNALTVLTPPANTASIHVTVTSMCGFVIGESNDQEFLKITQGEIDQYCENPGRLPEKGNSIFVANSKGNFPKTGISKAKFLKTYCRGEGSDGGPADGSRLPNIKEDKVDIAPNPYQYDFNINLSLRDASKISATLYSSNGQQIRQLVNNALTEPGIHNLKFDGSDLPSGVYLVRISVNSEVSVHKLVKIE